MANFTTSADCINAALDRAGEPFDGTSEYESFALEAINRAYQGIYSGGEALAEDVHEAWWWLRSALPLTITLEPSIENLTANVTNNSASVTLSSVVSKDLDRWFVKFGGSSDVFRISAHTSGSASITLDSVFTGDANTADSCILRKLEYDLPSDCMTILSPMRCYRENQKFIEGTSVRELESEYHIDTVYRGIPDKFAMISNSRVRFSHSGGNASTEFIRVDADYLARPSDLADDSAEPLIPREFRYILSYFTIFDLMIVKDDNRAEGYGKLARAGLKAMARENKLRWQRFSPEFGTVRPRIGSNSPKGPLRTESGFIIS